MSYYVARLKRPYNVRVLIEAYIYTKREDFCHTDFTTYYSGLLEALEKLFDICLSEEGLTFDQRILWKLFKSTVKSFLQITNPWSPFMEATLLVRKLEASGEPGKVVEQASAVIQEANKVSGAAHHDILEALFSTIFGEHPQEVTSEELLQAGFDDSQEPDISDYWKYW